MDKALCVQVEKCDSFAALFSYLNTYGNCLDLRDEESMKKSKKRIILGSILQLNPIVWKNSQESGMHDCLTMYIKTVLPDGGAGVRVRVNFLGDIVRKLHRSQLFEQDVIAVMNPRIFKSVEFKTLWSGPKNAIAWFWKSKQDMLPSLREGMELDITQSESISPGDVMNTSNVEKQLIQTEVTSSPSAANTSIKDHEVSGVLAKSILEEREHKKLQKQLRETGMPDKVENGWLSFKKSNRSTGYISGESSSLKRPNDSPRSEVNTSADRIQESNIENPNTSEQTSSLRDIQIEEQVKLILPSLMTKYFEQLYHDWWQNLTDRCPCAKCQLIPVCCEHKKDMSKCPSLSNRHPDLPPQDEVVSIKSVSVKSTSIKSDSGTSTPVKKRTEEWVKNVAAVGVPPMEVDDLSEEDKDKTIDLRPDETLVEEADMIRSPSPLPPPQGIAIVCSSKKRKLFTVPNGSDIFVPYKRSNVNNPPTICTKSKVNSDKVTSNEEETTEHTTTEEEEQVEELDETGKDSENDKSQPTIDIDQWAEIQNDKIYDSPNTNDFVDAESQRSMEKDHPTNEFSTHPGPEKPEFLRNLSAAALQSLNELFSFLDDDRRTTKSNLKIENEIFTIQGVLIGVIPEVKKKTDMSIIRGICRKGCLQRIEYENVKDENLSVKCEHCPSLSHWVCPSCLESTATKKPLCLSFLFELHLLNGLDIVRIECSGQDAEEFLGCTASRYWTSSATSSTVLKKLNRICVKSLPDKWTDCVVLTLTVRTVKNDDIIIPCLYKTKLDSCLSVQKKKFNFKKM